MNKHKRKISQRTSLQYWTDELIYFRRDFVIESTTSVADCAEAIDNLQTYEGRGFFRRGSIITSSVTPVDISDTIYMFEVNREQREKKSYHKSSSAYGTITTHDDGLTIIEGASKMNGSYYWFVISAAMCVALLSLPSAVSDRENLALVIWGFGLSIFLWWRMYRDRNRLIKEINKAVATVEKQERTSRLQDEVTTTEKSQAINQNKRDEMSG